MCVTSFEVEELACAMFGLDYDTLVDEGREREIEETLYNKYEIGIEQFVELIKDLLPFTPIVNSELQGKCYHAFVDKNMSLMIVKKEVEPKPEGGAQC